MADHLTPEDLAAFLRSRQSSNAKIAADFVDESPGHPDVAWCVDRLEELAREVGLELRWHLRTHPDGALHWYPSYVDSAAAGMVLDHANCILPVLSLFSSRFTVPAPGLERYWPGILQAALGWSSSRVPAWVSVCVRRLRRAAAVSV